jgi:hypothetical protein
MNIIIDVTRIVKSISANTNGKTANISNRGSREQMCAR